MQKTIKSIILSLTITAMVILFLPRYTTVNAADQYNYVVFDSTNDTIFVSYSEPVYVYYNSAGQQRPIGIGVPVYSSTTFSTPPVYQIYYSSTLGHFVVDSEVSLSTITYSYTSMNTSTQVNRIYRMSGSSIGSNIYLSSDFGNIKNKISSVNTSLDGTYLEGQDVSSIVEELLNSTTSTTTTANNLQSSLSVSANQYENGSISGDQLQTKIDSTVSQLNTLSSVESNTLADLIAVNNGLTYAQTVQDKLNADELNQHLEVTTSVANNIKGYLNVSNQAFTDYKNGVNSQSETITILQNQIIYLNNMVSNGLAKNSADVQAINTAINSVNGIISNVSNYSDLDSNLSDKVQNSDQAELDYLDSLSSDVTSSIQDMSAEKQFSSQQITQSQSILSAVWNLDIVKRLIPLASVFMVVCVALGIRYKL